MKTTLALALTLVPGALRAQSASGVRFLHFSHNGRILVSVDKSAIRLWDAPSGRQTALLKAGDGPVSRVAFSPDDALLASISSMTLHIWDAATGKVRVFQQPR